jgi:quinoprotein glucose dehydrogenase
MVHHNVWDWDMCANPPALGSVTENGKIRDVVICTSKQGILYVFDRVTGEPIHPIEEVPVPQTDIPGEQTSPTQPVPTFYKPFSRQSFKEEDLLNDPRLIPDSSYQFILGKFRELKSDHMWNPPSRQGTLQIPGLNGGNDWGGASFDPETQIIYIVDNTSPWIVSRIPLEEREQSTGNRQSSSQRSGPRILPGMTNLQVAPVIYRSSCQGCHGADMRGGETNPGLGPIKTLIGLKYDLPTVTGIISNGVGVMPANSELGKNETTVMAAFLLKNESVLNQKFIASPPREEPWFFTPRVTSRQGYGGKFLTPEGDPAIKPPWSEMVAVNLNTGEELWRKQIGGYKELYEKGIRTGAETFGAGVVTAGGLIFVSGSSAETIEALDKVTGELLWESKLPHAAVSTPSVYEVNGKQYIVISCGGGGKQLTKSGDEYVAFALPD